MADRKPAWLKRLVVDRIDLVDRGANPDADIVLFKRAREPDHKPPDSDEKRKGGEAVSDSWIRKALHAIAKKVGLSDEDLTKAMPMMPNEMLEHEKAMQEFWSLKYALTRSIDSIMGSDEMEMDKKMEMVGEAVKQFQESCKALMPHVQMEQDMYKVESFLDDLDAAGEDVAKVDVVVKALVPPDRSPDNKAPVNLPADTGPVNKKEGDTPMTLDEYLNSRSPEQRAAVEAEIAKRFTPSKVEIPVEVTKRIEDLEKTAGKVEELAKRAETAETKLAKAETALADEVEKRVQREFLEKAAKYPTSGTPDQVAAKLRKAYAVSPEFGAEIESDLQKTEELAKTSKLFESVGKSGKAPEGSAEDKLEKMAKALATDKSITFEKAYDRVLQENPDLYRQMRAEEEGK